MTTIGPAVILVLATIGAARVIRLAYLASRASLRALGRGLVSVGARLGRLGAKPSAAAAIITQADVDRAVADALAKSPIKSRAKRDPEVTEVSGN